VPSDALGALLDLAAQQQKDIAMLADMVRRRIAPPPHTHTHTHTHTHAHAHTQTHAHAHTRTHTHTHTHAHARTRTRTRTYTSRRLLSSQEHTHARPTAARCTPKMHTSTRDSHYANTRHLHSLTAATHSPTLSFIHRTRRTSRAHIASRRRTIAFFHSHRITLTHFFCWIRSIFRCDPSSNSLFFSRRTWRALSTRSSLR
jgi:hypothetical protein